MAKMCDVVNKLCDGCEWPVARGELPACEIIKNIKTYNPERDGMINVVIGR